MQPILTKLEVGNEYHFSYICDSSKRYGPIRVVKRTEKNVWFVKKPSDKPTRRKIRYNSDTKEEFFCMSENIGRVYATNNWRDSCWGRILYFLKVKYSLDEIYKLECVTNMYEYLLTVLLSSLICLRLRTSANVQSAAKRRANASSDFLRTIDWLDSKNRHISPIHLFGNDLSIVALFSKT